MVSGAGVLGAPLRAIFSVPGSLAAGAGACPGASAGAGVASSLTVGVLWHLLPYRFGNGASELPFLLM